MLGFRRMLMSSASALAFMNAVPALSDTPWWLT